MYRVFASILDALDQWNGADLLLNRYLNESYKLSAEQRFCISALLAMSDD